MKMTNTTEMLMIGDIYNMQFGCEKMGKIRKKELVAMLI